MTLLDDRPPVLTDLDDATPLIPMSSGLARWRLAGRLSRREVRRRPWRTLLVVLLVAVPVAAMASVSTAYRSSHLPRIHRDYGQFAARIDLTTSTVITDADVDAALRGVSPVAWGWTAGLPLRTEAHPDSLVGVGLSTMDLAAPGAQGMAHIDAGRLPAADDEVFLGSSVAAAFQLRVGDTFTLVRPHQTFRVVGIGAVGWLSDAFVAPGFDVGVIREGFVSAVVFAGRAAAEEQDVQRIDRSLSASSLAGTGGSWGLDRRTTEGATTDPVELFLGWLAGAMLMGVLGIVVAAAFAVSGRRQLVTIGQLSAAGTDPSVVRRFLALQGTWTGLVGAAVGLLGGGAFIAASGELIRTDGRLDLRLADWSVIAVTAVLVATIAAIVPSRSLANMSVLSALAGRRPITAVRRGQVRLGVLLVAAGLAVLFFAVMSARQANRGGESLAGSSIIAIVAGFAVLAGTCCVCPAIVAAVGWMGSTAGGSVRIATRGLDRHRARSAALIASIAAVGAAVVAMGAVGEQRQHDDLRNASPYGSATFFVSAYDNTKSLPLSADHVAPDLRARIGSIVGPVDWVQSDRVQMDSTGELPAPIIADPGVLAVYGFSRGEAARIAHADVTWAPSSEARVAMMSDADVAALAGASLGTSPASVVRIAAPASSLGDLLFISRSYAEAHHIPTVPDILYGTADHALSGAEVRALTSISTFDYEAAVFAGLDQATTYISISGPYSPHSWRPLYSWALAAIALTLVLLVVGLGMALWAAEGREERDALVSLGAPPSTLASVAALKAWTLATAGGIVAVPLGFGTLRLCIAAADRHTQFPWLISAVVLFVVPALISVITWVGSGVAQRVRPVRMSNLAAD